MKPATHSSGNIHPDLEPMAVPIDKLNLLPRNPRAGDVDAVARSYAEFGQQEIAVTWVDDDDMRARAYALAANRTGDLGGYDDDLLVEMLSYVADDADLLAAAAYSQEDIDRLIDGTEPPHGPVDDPDLEPPKTPRTVTGDVWTLGPHRLVCGDSTDPTVFEALLGDTVADMVWTDPPYGVAYVGKTKDALTIDNDTLDPAALEQFLREALGNACGATKDGGTWFVAAPPGPLFLPFGAVLGDLGIWRETLSWVKNSLVLGRSDYHYRHEAIFYGWRPGAAHREPPDRTGDTVWEFDRPSRSEDHPTMKPVPLIERAVHNHTDRHDIVLDPFGGSGSTLIACENLTRAARLIELDPGYCDVICRRYQTHTGQLPVLETTGTAHDFTQDL